MSNGSAFDFMSIPDAGQQPPLGHEELLELFTHLLLNARLFALAKSLIIPFDHFDDDDTAMAAVWTSALELADQGFGPPPPINALRSEVSRTLELTGYTELDDCLELFGPVDLPKWIRKKNPEAELYESDGAVSFFDRLRTTDAAELDQPRGTDLLRRFLCERYIIGPLREAFSCPLVPQNLTPVFEEFRRRVAICEGLTDDAVPTLEEEWSEHDQWLQQFRGRQYIGLRTGMCELDRRTLGLRDLVLLGAGPGVGKTALALNLAIGICSNHEDNDAVVVFISLEMDRNAIITRAKCNLADMDFKTLVSGSPDHQYRRQQRNGRNGMEISHLEQWFDEDDRARLCDMHRRISEAEIGRRLTIVDKQQVRERNFVDGIANLVRDRKDATGSARAIVFVDYLQVLPVPLEIEKQGDLAADRYRVSVLQDLLSAIHDGGDPDCVFAISEARKPPSSKERWGLGLAELMGSARLGYSAGAVLLYGGMDVEQIKHYYGPMTAPEIIRERRLENGIAPVELTLVKGRDGMHRGSWGVEYKFHRNRFEELHASRCEPDTYDQDADQACDQRTGQADSQISDTSHSRQQARRPKKKVVRKKAHRKKHSKR